MLCDGSSASLFDNHFDNHFVQKFCPPPFFVYKILYTQKNSPREME